jgi:hypothetical protein
MVLPLLQTEREPVGQKPASGIMLYESIECRFGTVKLPLWVLLVDSTEVTVCVPAKAAGVINTDAKAIISNEYISVLRVILFIFFWCPLPVRYTGGSAIVPVYRCFTNHPAATYAYRETNAILLLFNVE